MCLNQHKLTSTFGLYSYLSVICALGTLACEMEEDPITINAGEMLAGEVTAGEMLAGEVTAGEMLAGEMLAGEMLAGEMLAGEMLAGEMPAGEMPAGEVAAGEVTAGEMTAGEVTAGEVMVVCEGPNPALTCQDTGCEEGKVCVEQPEVCTPSSCDCDTESGEWLCTRDCGTSYVCEDLPPPMCDMDSDQDGLCDQEDPICNLDTVPQSCRPIPPECPRGEVPVLVNGCYNDQCVTWDACTPNLPPLPPEACGVRGAEPCPQNTFCHFPLEAMCGEGDLPGVCLPLDPNVACTEEYRPVCGCDGMTYSNECYAMTAGVSVSYMGECDQGMICAEDSDHDGLCNQEDPFCNRDESEAICEVIPPRCPEGQVPEVINGCFGQCVSWLECEALPPLPGQACGGRANLECPMGLFCAYSAEALCGATGAPGICEPIGPPDCPQIYQPVCGCDGQTYGNACQAHAAGVSVAQENACEAMIQCGGFAGLTCPVGMSCIDDPSDDCDPARGGADCIGICVGR